MPVSWFSVEHLLFFKALAIMSLIVAFNGKHNLHNHGVEQPMTQGGKSMYFDSTMLILIPGCCYALGTSPIRAAY